jgi:mono/diheme cytochrome c family protein
VAKGQFSSPDGIDPHEFGRGISNNAWVLPAWPLLLRFSGADSGAESDGESSFRALGIDQLETHPENGMSKKITIAVICLAALAGAGIWFAWILKTHGFSARSKPTRFEAFLARHARDLATPAAAKHLKNPLSPSPLDIAEGRDHFADHCAVCHANNGSGKTEMGGNMYPPAPDMRDRNTQDLSDGELFHIIKDGIRFTGMPGWGGEDEDNWKLVLFIRHLPELSPKEFELMKEINGQGPESSHQ